MTFRPVLALLLSCTIALPADLFASLPKRPHFAQTRCASTIITREALMLRLESVAKGPKKNPTALKVFRWVQYLLHRNNSMSDPTKQSSEGLFLEGDEGYFLAGLKVPAVRAYVEQVMLYCFQPFDISLTSVRSLIEILSHQKHFESARQALYAAGFLWQGVNNPFADGLARYRAISGAFPTDKYEILRPYLWPVSGKEDGLIVDIGCGNLAMAQRLLGDLRDQGVEERRVPTVVGIDLAPDPGIQDPHGKIRYIRQSVEHPERVDLPGGVADRVSIISTGHHMTMPVLRSILKEAERLLKPEGQCLLYEDTVLEDRPPESDAGGFASAAVRLSPENRRRAFGLLDWHRNHVIDGNLYMSIPGNYLTAKEWREAFSQAGLLEMEARHIGFRHHKFATPPHTLFILKKKPGGGPDPTEPPGASLGQAPQKTRGGQPAGSSDSTVLVHHLTSIDSVPQILRHGLFLGTDRPSVAPLPGLPYHPNIHQAKQVALVWNVPKDLLEGDTYRLRRPTFPVKLPDELRRELLKLREEQEARVASGELLILGDRQPLLMQYENEGSLVHFDVAWLNVPETLKANKARIDQDLLSLPVFDRLKADLKEVSASPAGDQSESVGTDPTEPPDASMGQAPQKTREDPRILEAVPGWQSHPLEDQVLKLWKNLGTPEESGSLRVLAESDALIFTRVIHPEAMADDRLTEVPKAFLLGLCEEIERAIGGSSRFRSWTEQAIFENLDWILTENFGQHVLPRGFSAAIVVLRKPGRQATDSPIWIYIFDTGLGMNIKKVLFDEERGPGSEKGVGLKFFVIPQNLPRWKGILWSGREAFSANQGTLVTMPLSPRGVLGALSIPAPEPPGKIVGPISSSRAPSVAGTDTLLKEERAGRGSDPTESTGPSMDQAPQPLASLPPEAQKALHHLDVLKLGLSTNVISIGATPVGFDPLKRARSSLIPWEWYFLNRGARVAVFQGGYVAHRQWEGVRKQDHNSLDLLQVNSYFPYSSDERESGIPRESVDAVIMMSVLSDFGFSDGSAFLSAPPPVARHIDHNADLLRAALSKLRPGGLFILGWYNQNVSDIERTNMVLKRFGDAEQLHYRLEVVAEGSEPVLNSRGESADEPTHDWQILRKVPVGSDASETKSIELVPAQKNSPRRHSPFSSPLKMMSIVVIAALPFLSGFTAGSMPHWVWGVGATLLPAAWLANQKPGQRTAFRRAA